MAAALASSNSVKLNGDGEEDRRKSSFKSCSLVASNSNSRSAKAISDEAAVQLPQSLQSHLSHRSSKRFSNASSDYFACGNAPH